MSASGVGSRDRPQPIGGGSREARDLSTAGTSVPTSVPLTSVRTLDPGEAADSARGREWAISQMCPPGSRKLAADITHRGRETAAESMRWPAERPRSTGMRRSGSGSSVRRSSSMAKTISSRSPRSRARCRSRRLHRGAVGELRSDRWPADPGREVGAAIPRARDRVGLDPHEALRQPCQFRGRGTYLRRGGLRAPGHSAAYVGSLRGAARRGAARRGDGATRSRSS